jgi:hypothetical protein
MDVAKAAAVDDARAEADAGQLVMIPQLVLLRLLLVRQQLRY